MNQNLFNKVFLVLTILMIVFQATWVGMALQSGDVKSLITDGILLLFWLFSAIFWNFMIFKEQKHSLELNQAKKDLDNSFKEMTEELATKHAETLHDISLEEALVKANKEICGDRPPKPSEFEAVQDLFHKLTDDHYLLLEESDSERPKATISDEPFVNKTTEEKKGK